ncbi:MAG: Ig-like domain-containing protein [Verrucomicrobiales bacterium]|nr:Ig-like domain-containing protein [Verrucomicrobiales bacterium]
MLWLSALGSVSAQTATFDLKGVRIELQEITADTAVFFRSLRLNRALNQWNVEVTVSNRADRAVSGPLVLLVESFRGTSGPLLVDGTLPGATLQSFYDLSSFLPGSELGARQTTASRTLSLGFSSGSPVLVTRVFAGTLPPPVPVGVTRSLNEVGQPLPGATLTVTGPTPESSAVLPTDHPTGVASFGGSSGLHRLRFSLDGNLSVWRQQTLSTGNVAVVPNPRLTPRSSRVVELTPLGGSVVTNDAGTVRIVVNAGAFGGSASLRLTGLTGQTLPAFLPQGWSPMVAFHLESSSPPAQPLPAALTPAGPVGTAEVAALVHWNENSLSWEVVQVLGGRGAEPLDVFLPKSGSYALVVGDTGELVPPVPNAGQPLQPSAAVAAPIAGLTATGVVDPSSSPASQIPARVTGQATVTLNHASAKLPSGTLLRGEVTETYLLKDGSARVTPSYEQFFVAYQRPGDENPQTIQASFPMRPLLLFGSEELASATVRIQVLPLAPFDGRALDQRGGQLALPNGGRVLIGAGQLTGPTAFRISPISLAPFTNALPLPMSALGGFELTFDGGRLTGPLAPRFDGLPTNAVFVLARVVSEVGLYGLEPVERLVTSSVGSVSSAEPLSGDRLPGIRGSGQYVLIRVDSPQGLISGVARDGQGSLRSGMPVRTAGTPWLALTDAQGRYRLVASSGSRQIEVTDPVTGDSGSSLVTVVNPLEVVTQDLVSAPVGPRVISITPADNATKVAPITAITLQFSEPLNPATVVGNGIQLLGSDGLAVTASMSLDPRLSRATLTPGTTLDAGTTYRVVLARTIADSSGMALVGTNEFRFTTLAASRVGETIAELVIYQPGATNVPAAIVAQIPAYRPGTVPNAIVVHGSVGTADPEVPVILVNESTGDTATVLSNVDGSFASVISGGQEDIVTATFVNLNGTRVYVATARQEFDNGFTGLFTQGGVLEAQSPRGPVRLTVPANAISTKTKFKLESLSVAAVTNALGGLQPSEGAIAGSALNLRVEGQLPVLPLKIRMPVNLAELGYPADEVNTNAAVMLAAVRTTGDITAFQVMDQMLFTPDPALVEPPPTQPQLAGNNDQIAAGFLDTSIGLMMPALGIAGQVAQIGFNQILVPLLFGPRPVVIKGKAAALPLDLAEAMERAGLINQLANTQTGNRNIDVPWQIAQMLGVPNPITRLGGGVIQQLTSVAATTFLQQSLVVSKPLPGAFISVTLNGGPLNSHRHGRIFPGMVYATTGSDGYFLAMAPAAGAQYLVRATHPAYDEVKEEPANPITWIPGQQGDLTLSGAVWKNFFFLAPRPSDTPPDVSIANTPVYPAPGQPTEIVIQASLPDRAPKIGVLLQSIGTTNLLTGLPEVDVAHSLTNIQETTQGYVTRWTATLTVNKPVLASFKATFQGATGEQGLTTQFGIAFTGKAPTVFNPDIPKPDTNDVHGPLVSLVQPADNGFLKEDGRITILFNKPIDAAVKQDLSGITLAGAPLGVLPVVELSSDQQVLTLKYPSLPSDQTYQLTLSARSIRDLAQQPMDQVPSTPQPDSFTTSVRTPPSATAPLLNLDNAKGSVMRAGFLYVIDQESAANSLKIFNVRNPLHPSLERELRLPGAPRDIALIPQFSYKRTAQSPVVTSDLIAIVGGDLDAVINQVQGVTVSVKGQYLWVVDVADPQEPIILASPLVSLRVGSAATKVRWSPPHLVYQEFGADIQLLGFVNLQEMIYGFGITQRRQEVLPTEPRPGKDLNGDGDYVDEGELLPIPQNFPSEFYGKKQSLLLQGTTQKILDFAVSDSGNTVGVTLRNGIAHDEQGRPRGATLPPMYRTWVYNGIQQEIGNPLSARYDFPISAYPRWVSVFDALPLVISNTPSARAVALVTLSPNTNGLNSLAVIDISLPLAPKLLSEIILPSELLGGGMGPVQMRPDGLLQIAGATHLVTLDPHRLVDAPPPSGQLHASILSSTAQAGGLTRSLGQTDYGLSAVAEGRRGLVVVSQPELRFVSFPNQPTLVNPSKMASMGDVQVEAILNDLNPLRALAPAQPTNAITGGSDLMPPNRSLHYHVMMITPGAAGETVEFGLESVNPAGLPLSNLGVGFAPVRAVSDFTQASLGQTPKANCGAPIRSLVGYRLSNNPQSRYYNYYLSRPFALITSVATISELEEWKTVGSIEREILFSGAGMRAFLDPVESDNEVLGAFAARIDGKRLRVFPIASGSAETVNRDYLVGDNPPPPGASTPIEDTFGAIQAHSGELRTTDVDMSLPSPRMPIQITRTIGTQDNYEGPFGVGWDFNYNERLMILDSATFPAGLQMPLVIRDKAANSDIAGSQDVLFTTGMGRVYTFVWKGTNMPPEYAQDPLVRDFEYSRVVSDYYLPVRGIFDLLVKFKDGRFERLTPDGQRYRYTSKGRLQTIIDRYPKNRHELEYDRNGWLVRIDDRSVSGPRFVEFGYYRRKNSDNQFRDGLDEDTSNPFLEGKICRLRDYANRDVLYQYDPDGFLIANRSIQVNGENGGYSGRGHTFYTYENCRLASISAKASGTPVVAAATVPGARGKPVTRATTGSLASNQLDIPQDNSAANVGSIQSGVRLGDGASVQRRFDAFGHTISETMTGPAGGTSGLVVSNTVDGLVTYIRHPEGNVELRSYDSGNVNFRSRANLLSTTMTAGPRGGAARSERFSYEPRYNLPAGEHVDANGFVTRHVLTSDGRDIGAVEYPDVGIKTSVYDSNGQVILVKDQDGLEAEYSYDARTGFIQTAKAGDKVLRYSYDGSIPGLLGKPASVAQALGAPTTYTYDNNLQPVRVQRGGLVSLLAYDELGRDILSEDQVGDGKVSRTTKEYNDAGFLIRLVTSGIEIEGTVGSFAYEFKPDARSRIQESILPNGTRQVFTYDARGNILTSTLGSYVERYEYDLNNNLKRVFQGGDEVRSLEYDGLDRATKVVQKTGFEEYVEQSQFHPDGQLLSRTVTDSRFGIVEDVRYPELDSMGRHKTVQAIGGVISPRHSYTYGSGFMSVAGPRLTYTSRWDAGADQIGYTDPNQTVTVERDDNGRPTVITHTEQGATYAQTFGYDDLDHQKSAEDLQGLFMTYVPRADGTPTKVTNARGNSTSFENTALGEPIRQQRADGMEMRARYDAQRQTTFNGDPGAGFGFGYDGDLRLTQQSLRNGALMTFANFDPRNMPQTQTFPGGSATMVYDLQRRLLQRTMSYQGTSWEENTTYDAFSRIRSQTYAQNGGAAASATYDYDPAGPLLFAECVEDNATFRASFGYYEDGTRKSVTYPSGLVVTEERDATGRLTGLSASGAPILTAVSWQGTSHPKIVELGSSMQTVNEYDKRGRLTGSRTTRRSDNAVLAHMRYQYDPANNLEMRQFWHRNGLADNFAFDTGERLLRAQVGGIPLAPTGFTPSLYERSFTYGGGGLDLLTAAPVSNALVEPPSFAQTWTGHDAFLLPTSIDGFERGPADPKGNTARANLWVRAPGAVAPSVIGADLKHDGFGRLVSVAREDGALIENQYQPSGLRFSRKVTQGGFTLSRSHYVYDPSGRLLEEYDRTGEQPVLVGRYIYASSDAPVAADLPNPTTGELDRFYFIRDAAQSVIAVATSAGEIVERVWYDPFGQPVIQARDQQAPRLREVKSSEDGNALLIALSESVWPTRADPGPGGGIVRVAGLELDPETLSVTALNTNLPGTIELLPSVPGYPPYSVLKFTASREIPDLPSSLNSWWPGDRNVSDVAGGRRGSLVGGAAMGPGLVNEAFVLNGTSAYVNVPNDSGLNTGTSDFTVAVWVNFRNAAGEQVLIEKWASTPAQGWSMLKLADNRLRLSLGGVAVNIDSAPLVWTTNSWTQYAFRRQGSQFTLFTNGVAVASGTSTATLDSSSSLKFGSREGAGAFLNGALDEIAVFQRALSEPEIRSISGGLFAPGDIQVTLNAGKLSDEWGNPNVTATVSVDANDQPNVVYYQAFPEADTAPQPLARSAVGSPFLFQGQYFDYDTGLVYMRARYYDPYAGMFLEPDPLGYDSSVNHYAGLANNPVSARDPFGLTPRGITPKMRSNFLRSKGYSSHEVKLFHKSYSTLSRLGMGDLEIASHIRVMYKAQREQGITYEMSIRTFGNPKARQAQLDRFHQTKEEKVSNKTEECGLAIHQNKDGSVELFTGDLDGLYLLRNGQVSTLRQTQKFQEAVNREVARLSSGWKHMAEKGGQEIHGTQVQKAYQHGVSFNIPQEYGTRNKLMEGGRCGFAGFDWIESKMLKGTGTAFSFRLDDDGSNMKINESVDVNKMLNMYDSHYKDVMLNPNSKGFDRVLHNRRLKQYQRDGRRPSTLFPKTFFGHDYGSPGAN